jgi:hypothetical protein
VLFLPRMDAGNRRKREKKNICINSEFLLFVPSDHLRIRWGGLISKGARHKIHDDDRNDLKKKKKKFILSLEILFSFRFEKLRKGEINLIFISVIYYQPFSFFLSFFKIFLLAWENARSLVKSFSLLFFFELDTTTNERWVGREGGRASRVDKTPEMGS